MKISLIVANSKNGTIGINGNMPWSIPQDLKRFRLLTKNSIVIMGRKTYESIGKPLSERCNFVISSSDFNCDDLFQFKNIDSALKFAKEEMPTQNIFVIGGASIYNQFLELDLVDKIYQTVIEEDVDGDTFFEFDKSKWEILEEREAKLLNKGELINCTYKTYSRIKNKTI